MNEILESNNPQHEYWLTRNYWSASIGRFTKELIIEIKNFVCRSPCWWVENMLSGHLLHLIDCVGEKKFGLAYILMVKCNYLECGLVNDVPTGRKERCSAKKNITVPPTCLGRPNRWNQQWHARCSRASKPRAKGKFNCINRFLVKFKRDNFIFCR